MRGDIVVHKAETSQREKKNRFMRSVLIGAILLFLLLVVSIKY